MLSVFVFTTFICLATPSTLARNSRDVDELISKKMKALALLRSAVEDMNEELNPVSKRGGCDINLPGFDCDHRLMIHNGDDAGWWSAGITPGKKRRSCINADGSSCDNAQIALELSNRRPWMNGPGRRKRGATAAVTGRQRTSRGDQ